MSLKLLRSCPPNETNETVKQLRTFSFFSFKSYLCDIVGLDITKIVETLQRLGEHFKKLPAERNFMCKAPVGAD